MKEPSHFYETHIEPIEDRMIRSVWRVTRNAQDAEDAMQNALMAIWKRRHRIGQHAVPEALILRICVDAACDVARRSARHRRKTEPADPAEHIIDATQSPSEDLAQRELCDEVLTAIHRLCRRQAVAVTLRAIEGLPYEQVAAALDCSEATARKHVERARRHLRVVLSRHAPDHIARSS